MKISFFNQTEENTKASEKLIKSIFKHIENEKTMQVVFLTQEQIHEMNKFYRNVDRPTDVLSFPDESDDSLGDIFISLEQASIQASEYGHSFEREVGFLSVHGYLHLLGYDHYTPEEEKIMLEEQEKILKKVGLERK